MTRPTFNKSLLLLEIESYQITVMLLSNGISLEDIIFKLLLRLSGIKYQEGQQEHSLILALQFLQKRFCILAVSSQI